MEERTETFQGGGEARMLPASESRQAREPLRERATLGPYELLYRLGGGGMADVWVAVRRGGFGFRQLFAVKTIRPEYAKDTAFRTMFLDEARLASQVRHTHVLPVLDLGEENETVYQAMPLVEGGSVAALAERSNGALPPGIALRIGIDVARGLHAAHEAKDEAGQRLELVHRDVSPHNILVGVDGIAKVADFGIAKAFGVGACASVIGKRGYLAPEQLGGRAVDRRADVFSLGVVLWELLTGQRLFKTDNAGVFFEGSPRVPDVRAHRPDVPAAIGEVIARALPLDTEARYATAEAFADSMENAARDAKIELSSKQVGLLVERLLGAELEARALELSRGPAEAEAARVEEPAPRRSTRRAWPAIAVACAIALLASIVVGLTRTRESSSPVVGPAATPLATPLATTSAILSAEQSPSASSPAPSSAPARLPSAGRSPRRKTAPAPKFSDNPYAR